MASCQQEGKIPGVPCIQLVLSHHGVFARRTHICSTPSVSAVRKRCVWALQERSVTSQLKGSRGKGRWKAELKTTNNSNNGGKKRERQWKTMPRGMTEYLFQRVTPSQCQKAAWTPLKHTQDHQEAHEVSGTLSFQATHTDISHVLQRERWLVVLRFTVFVTFDRINNQNSGVKLKWANALSGFHPISL